MVASSAHLLVPGSRQIPASLENIFGFLDCTAIEICRPTGNPDRKCLLKWVSNLFSKYYKQEFN